MSCTTCDALGQTCGACFYAEPVKETKPKPKIGRPTKHTSPTIPKSFRLTEPAVNAITQAAHEHGCSQADVIESWAAGESWNREAIAEVMQLLEGGLKSNDKGRISSAVVREALELLGHIR